MDAFDRGRDTRSPEAYQHTVNMGIHNEGIICSELLRQYGVQNRQLQKDEKFKGRKKFNESEYTPDRWLWVENSWHLTEVKVKVGRIYDFIDFKAYQTEQLRNWKGHEGFMFFSNETHYDMISAERIMFIGNWVSAQESKVNKNSYRVDTSHMRWKEWQFPIVGLKSYRHD